MKCAKTWMGWLMAGALAFGAMPSRADTETLDGVEWSYTVTNGTATVTGAEPAEGALEIPVKLGGVQVAGIGAKAFSGCTNLTTVKIPDDVTSIGNHAFSECQGLTSVTIPEGVASIGMDAFYKCAGLTSVTIPGSVKSIGGSAFYLCKGVSSLTISEGVKSIGRFAFYGCHGVVAVAIPDSVASIGENAFGYCPALGNIAVGTGNASYESEEGVLFEKGKGMLVQFPAGKGGQYEIPEGVTRIEEWAFSDCTNLTAVAIPGSVTNIGFEAFNDCTGLTTVRIPGSVTSIANSAFYGCKGLTSATISRGVANISGEAFYGCSRLSEVAIPDSVTNIGYRAFAYCYALPSVTIPASVASVGVSAFRDCSSLNEIVVDWGNTAYESFEGVLFDKGRHTLVEFPGGQAGTYEIPEGVTEIGEEAFYYCKGLADVAIPDSVTNIGRYAFCNCSGLKTVPIPGSVASIGEDAFAFCSKLASVTIADGVATIGNYAFARCSALTSVAIPDSVTNLGTGAFSRCSKLQTIEVSGAWEGTAVLAAAVPEGCTVIYRKKKELVDGVEWEYGVSGGTATVTGVEPVAGEMLVPSKLGGMPVTGIGSGVFSGGEALTSVTIPESVAFVGANAFSGCTGLMTLHVPESWSGTDMLAGAGIPEGCAVVYRKPQETVDGVTWRYIVANGAATVTGAEPAEGTLAIPEELGGIPVAGIASNAFGGCAGLTNVVISGGVTNVGEYAFNNCTGLKSVTIPGSVKRIEYEVFYGCLGLQAVYIHDLAAWCRISFATSGSNPLDYAHHLFVDGEEVTNLVIPDSITSIGEYAFASCEGLVSATIPGTVTGIGKWAFYACTNLASVTISDGVMRIAGDAFLECKSLKEATIPASVESIGIGAFRYCLALEEFVVEPGNAKYESEGGGLFTKGKGELVQWPGGKGGDCKIPDGVTKIWDYAFYGCTGVTGVTIPGSVTNVGTCAFRECTGLKSVTISDGVKSIGYEAFSGCRGLQAVHIHDLAAWCRISFAMSESNPLDFAHHLFVDGEEVTKLVIPDSTTSVGKYAFAGCGGLASATIPETVTGIGYGAFFFCTNLASVTISDGVKRIDGDAFSGCESLKEAAIPASVESIGTGAFQYCLALEEIVVEPENAKYESEEGVLFTKGKGELVQWPGGKSGDYEIPDGVTRICNYSFYGCTGVTGVTIPGSVTNVGAYAFCDCAGLTNVVMDKGVESLGARAFQNCTGLTTLTIPGSVARVGANAFLESGLVILYVPESWKGTTMLASARVPWGCTVVYDGGGENEPVWSYSVEDGQATVTGVSLAEGELVLPDTLGGFPVTAIGEYAFWNCSGLTGLTIPEGVTVIDSYAFRGCHGLTSLTVPASVTHIGYYPFSYCNGLEEITVAGDNECYASEDGVLFSKDMEWLIWCPDAKRGDYAIPEGVKFIDDSALRGSTNLTSVAIPASVESIGRYAFAYCSGLKDITVAEGNECFASEDGVLFSKDKKTLLCCPGGKTGTYAIPDGVKCIGHAAFCGCMRVTLLGIPDSVTSIQRDAFGGCSDSIFDDARISGVRLVDGWAVDWKEMPYGKLELVGIRGIADRTFSGCTGLTAVAIGNGAAGIGERAFYGCTGLAEVEVPETVKTIGSQAFSDSGLAKLVVPMSWEGTDMLEGAGVPEGCEVVYAKAVGQKLEWTALKDRYAPDERVTLEASARGGKVLFEVLAGPGVVEGNLLSFTGAGLVTVRACQPGGARWRAVEETRRVLVVAESGGRRVYADLAANYAADGWVDGSNGGEGFGPWRIAVTEGSGAGWAGFGVWNPSANGFTGEWEGKSKAFSMVGKGNGWSIAAARDFARPLGIGDSFSLEMGIRLDSHVNGALKGFALTAGGEDVVVVNHENSPGKISVNGDDGYEAANVVGLHPMTWTFTAMDATNIQFTATGRDDPGNVCTGMLPVATSAIDGFRLQSANQYFYDSTNEERDGRQNYYDNFRLSQKLSQQKQGIAWDEIGPQEVGARVELAATADSGSEVAFVVLSGPALIDGNTLTFTGSGAARVMAWVAGDETWTWASLVQTVEASWAPERATETGVPYVWLEEHAEDILVETGGDLEEAANAVAKNGRKVWECFVAGLDPMVEEDDFRAEMKWKDGKLVVVASKEMPEGRVVKVEGRKGLEEGAADWTELKEGEDWQAQGWRFFRVGVGLAE